MDPKITLRDALLAMEDGDREGAAELLRALADWVESGGFMPSNLVMVSLAASA